MSSTMNGHRTREETDEQAKPSRAKRPENQKLVPPKRRSNTIWMVAGIALILISGLSAATLVQSLSSTVEVVVAARPIAEGEPVTADDFDVANLSTSSANVQAIEPERIEELVGLTAAGPIGEGSIVHPDSFIADSMINEATVLVGAALGPDNYPRAVLEPGDVVRLIELSSSTAVLEEGVSFATGGEIATGEIVEVSPLSGDSLHFSIRIGESSANRVVDRIASNRLSIALMDDPQGVEAMQPLEAEDMAMEDEDMELSLIHI